jgi:hypothetical protein
MLPLRKLIKYTFHINKLNRLYIKYSKKSFNEYICPIFTTYVNLTNSLKILYVEVLKKHVYVQIDLLNVNFKRSKSRISVDCYSYNLRNNALKTIMFDNDGFDATIDYRKKIIKDGYLYSISRKYYITNLEIVHTHISIMACCDYYNIQNINIDYKNKQMSSIDINFQHTYVLNE